MGSRRGGGGRPLEFVIRRRSEVSLMGGGIIFDGWKSTLIPWRVFKNAEVPCDRGWVEIIIFGSGILKMMLPTINDTSDRLRITNSLRLHTFHKVYKILNISTVKIGERIQSLWKHFPIFDIFLVQDLLSSNCIQHALICE